jgi:hypothetical protein
MDILHEATVAHLGETEDALDDQEFMLDFASTFDFVVFFAYRTSGGVRSRAAL